MKKLVVMLLVAVLLIPNFAVAERAEAEYATPETITRAEFARIVVTMRNFGNIPGSGLHTGFNDVPQEHWASAYVAMAADMDVVRGDSGHNGRFYRGLFLRDSNFRPDDVITLEEAIAMLVRAIGGQPIANANGGFPSGYFYVAEMLGITDGVDFDLRTLVNRTLDAPMVFSACSWTYCGGAIRIMDGTYYRTFQISLITLRNSVFDEKPVYFDGENFVIGDYKNE